jgi:hypothetical protein
MDAEVRRLTLSTGITVPCLIHGDPTARPLLLLHADLWECPDLVAEDVRAFLRQP